MCAYCVCFVFNRPHKKLYEFIFGHFIMKFVLICQWVNIVYRDNKKDTHTVVLATACVTHIAGLVNIANTV